MSESSSVARARAKRGRAASAPAPDTPAHTKAAPTGGFYAAGPALSLSAPVQTQLVVGKAGDPFEREADTVAERVASGRPAPPITPVQPALLQRQAARQDERNEQEAQPLPVQREAATGQDKRELPPVQPLLQRQIDPQAELRPDQVSNDPRLLERQQPDQEQQTGADDDAQPLQLQTAGPQPLEEEHDQSTAVQACECTGPCSCAGSAQGTDKSASTGEMAQAKARSGAGPAQPGSAVSRAVRAPGPGEPLAPGVRSPIERGTGFDLRDVRVHRDSTAREAARALGARAFTHKSDIWLGVNESPADLQLLAHEVAHTLQQGQTVPLAPRGAIQPNVARPVTGLAAGERPDEERIQRAALYSNDDGVPHLLLWLPFGGELVFFFLTLAQDVATEFDTDDSLAQAIDSELTGIFNPPDQPLHETAEYIGGPAVKQLIERGLRAIPSTGSPDFSALDTLLQARTALFYSQALLAPATEYLAGQLGIAPAEIDWNALLPGVRTLADSFEPQTLFDASLRDRYIMFLDMLAVEAAALDPVAGAAAITAEDADYYLLSYVSDSGSALFSQDVFAYHSEKFLEEYIPLLEGLRYVPENFDLERFRPGEDTGRIDERRDAIVTNFIEQEAHGRVIRYILDRWTESAQSPEEFLSNLDLEEFRAEMTTRLAEELAGRALQDQELMAALRLRAFDQARFFQVAWIYHHGLALEARNRGLWDTFATTPLDELSAEDAAIGADPYAYYAISSTVADTLRNLLAGLAPNAAIEAQVVRAGAALLQAQDLPAAYAGIFLLPELLTYLNAFADGLEQQGRAIEQALKDRLDLDFDDIAETVRNWSDYANTFIEEEWKPMLKEVALEWLEANRAEIQEIYDNFDVSDTEFTDRLNSGADELDLLADRLEDGSYESVAMDEQELTVDDVDQLRTAAQFLRDEALARSDPERQDEQREQLLEALEVYDTVKTDLENDEYDPLDYSRAVYEEARARLGISEFDEFTTVGMVLKGQVTAEQNPFLAQAIVAWHWREGVERSIETGLLLGGLTILTVAAMLVPGVGGLVLGAIDIGIGVGMGVKQINDANEVLDMARLDLHQDIRGVSVADAERALRHAWIGLGVTIVLTAGPIALSRALRVRGGGGVELPPGVRQWEEGVSSETRRLLRENPALRRRFAEMSPAARRLLTHCSSICIPQGLLDTDVARIEDFLMRAQRMRGKSGTFGEVHEWMLREYFFSRRSNIGQAISNIEGIRDLNLLEKRLRLAASQRAVALRAAAQRRAGLPVTAPTEPTAPVYRHAIDTHGAERSPVQNWNRAIGERRRGEVAIQEAQGQWYDNRFIVDAHNGANATNQVNAVGNRTVHEFDLPYPAGRIYMPDGRIIHDVRRVRVIMEDGNFFNAYPIAPEVLPLR